MQNQTIYQKFNSFKTNSLFLTRIRHQEQNEKKNILMIKTLRMNIH